MKRKMMRAFFVFRTQLDEPTRPSTCRRLKSAANALEKQIILLYNWMGRQGWPPASKQVETCSGR